MANKKFKFSHILIIDDSDMDNMLNKMILQVANYSDDILTFSCPNDALKYLRGKAVKPPEVIFLDINMPEMDGFEFMEEFEKLPPTVTGYTKVIIISSSDDPIDVQKASKHKSIVKYLKKPLNREELY
jgi:CheY-like chemotaxis protein